MNSQPLISVVLPIYKVPPKWLNVAIESILNQTFSDFECIIVLDDPSNSEVEEIINAYKKQDNRIIIIKNIQNIGLPKSLNKAIKIAKGKYIARMDADDISLLDRFEKQVNFLEHNPNISICGGQAIKIDESGNEIGVTKNATSPQLLKRLLPFENSSTHPTWMIRKNDILEIGLYRNFPNAEDYDVVTRMITNEKKVTNLSDSVLKYRMHYHSQSGRKSLEQKLCISYIQELYRERLKTGKDSFDESLLHTHLTKHSQAKNDKQNNLWKARLAGANNPLTKVSIILKTFITSRIDRRYLINLFKARIIKMRYGN